MVYDNELADRVRAVLGVPFTEVRMFGSLAFMVNTNLAVGVQKDHLLLRLPKNQTDASIARGAEPAIMGGRQMGGFLTVAMPLIAEDDALLEWINPSVTYAQSLAPKRR
jgi:TfoX/Sxy family transcriptional regulator of competence genes